MITAGYAQTMARYNRWQNRSLYAAASTLTDAQRKQDRGAFFGSLHGTLCHILIGDQAWMHRFAGTPAPRIKSMAETAMVITDWTELARDRQVFDAVIIAWADRLDPTWLAGETTWHSMVAGRTLTRPNALLVAHFYNHQTHHRGQAHCLLTGLGARPEDTDLPFMPEVA